MPRPRRRTLSHSEIENFLTEISAVENQDGPIKPGQANNENQQGEGELLVETVGEDTVPSAPNDEAQLIRDFCKVRIQF